MNTASQARHRTVVVTRQEGPDGRLSRCLSRRGYRVLNWPVIQTRSIADDAQLNGVLNELPSYDWLIITSPRAAKTLAARRSRIESLPRLALVGKESHRRLRKAGFDCRVELQAESAAALADKLANSFRAGERALFLSGTLAPDTIPAALTAMDVRVDRMNCYKTEFVDLDRGACLKEIEAGEIAAVTFASSSAVKGLERALSPEIYAQLMSESQAFVMGDASAAAVEASGFVAIEAPSSALRAIADAVDQHCNSENAS